jgi:DNA-binding XRE family transcriptional regulator
MAKVLLELDHREQRGPALLAKKIGQRLAMLADGIRSDGVITRTIGRLLEEIGELPWLEERNHHWAGRTRDRFDAAMQLLHQVGVFTAVEWPDGFGPDDADRSRGWADKWMQAKMVVTLPDVPPEADHKPRALPARRGTSKPAPKSSAFDLTDLRQLRKLTHWTQKGLADYLGIQQPYLSKIEQGHMPSDAIYEKLSLWVAKVKATLE